MNNKTIEITIKNVPENFIKGMYEIMKTSKFKIDKEIIKPPDDYKFNIDFRDALISPESMSFMNSMISCAFTLFTFNPDGTKTPNIEL